MPKIAVLQMNSGIDPEANYAVIKDAAHQAKAGGADIMFTPEMSILLDRNRTRAAQWIDGGGPAAMEERLRGLARDVGFDIALGSMPVPEPESGKWANRSYYFSGRGLPPRTYDKIHMFDVELSTGETWRESAAFEPGKRAVNIGDSAVGNLGLTVCYDVRFPALFEHYGKLHTEVIAVPAAFTVPTGLVHWHTLLRARAIEATGFVVAAAQVGKHEDGRETYGHSLVVDPWGEVLVDMGGEGPGLGFCDIDMTRIAEVRDQLPALANKQSVPKYEDLQPPSFLK